MRAYARSLFVLRRQKTLRSNISELVESIEVEEAKAEQLRKRIAASTGDTLDRQEELLRQLNKEVCCRWEGELRLKRTSFVRLQRLNKPLLISQSLSRQRTRYAGEGLLRGLELLL